MDILLYKKDLERYSTRSLRLLQRYFRLPMGTRPELLWAIAEYQANARKQKASFPADYPRSGAIAAGVAYSLAILTDGSVLGWGDNDSGQSENQTPPSGTRFIQVSAARAFSGGLLDDGTIRIWGGERGIPDPDEDPIFAVPSPPLGTKFIQVSIGLMHALALLDNGNVAGWGDNRFGQAVDQIAPSGTKFIQVVANFTVSYALSDTGSVKVWGEGVTQSQIDPPRGTRIIQISASGGYISGGVLDNGKIYTWSLDGGTRNEYSPPGGTRFIQTVVTDNYILGLLDTGDIRVYGAIGYETLHHDHITPPYGSKFVQIAGSVEHALALTDKGIVMGFGDNRYGERVTKNINVQQEGELPYGGNLQEAMRAGDREAIRQIMAVRREQEAERSRLAVAKQEENVPEEAQDCENPMDYVTQEEWDEDNLPTVKITFWDANDPINGSKRTVCYSNESLIRWLQDPATGEFDRNHQLAVWVPNREGGHIDDNGMGGGPSASVVVVLPDRHYLFNPVEELFEELIEKKPLQYIAIPLAKHLRLGNLAGIFGVSNLHGQIPGETVYYIFRKDEEENLKAELRIILQSELTNRIGHGADLLQQIIPSVTDLRDASIDQLIHGSWRLWELYPAIDFDYDREGRRRQIHTSSESGAENIPLPHPSLNESSELSEDTDESEDEREREAEVDRIYNILQQSETGESTPTSALDLDLLPGEGFESDSENELPYGSS